MSSKKIKQIEHNLLGSLLQDIQTLNPNKKIQTSPSRMQTSSAPPVFLDIDYKLDFDFLDSSTFDSRDPEDQNIMEAFSKKQPSISRSLDPSFSPSQSYRKMSCDSSLLKYCDQSNMNSFEYYDYTKIYSPMEELFNHLDRVSQWTRDQNGSRTIQDVFQNENDERKDAIFYAIFKNSLNLITDKFGNYVFQKVFEKGLPSHKQLLMKSLWGSINTLSLHAYGCRVIQKAIQYMKDHPEDEQKFITEINQNSLNLIENQNGNHVIQKCFEVFSHHSISQIANIITNNLKFLAYHTYGCRVIQKYLQNYSNQLECQSILESLLEQSIPLSQCQFGNYVMQHIVTKCKEERKKVFEVFLQHVFQLSTNKYASNVMEKAIQAPESKFCQYLCDWFLVNQKELVILSKHQFGNYVVQSMISKVSNQKRAQLRNILKENASQISKSQHGKHVLLQIENYKTK